MILKKRKIPFEILIFEAVLRRLPIIHPRRTEFQNKVIRRRAGYKGEKEVDYHLEQLTDDNFIIINDLRLPHKATHFQIDTLILAPSFILILESKNYAGTLDIDPEFDQMIRTLDNKEEAFLNPILQAKIQTSRLKNWFAKHQIPPPPIEFLVTISNPQTIVRNLSRNKEISYRVCRTARIPFKLADLGDKYSTEIFSKKEMKKAARTLMKSHEPRIPNAGDMKIPIKDLATGVQCPKCFSFPMDRLKGNWYCKICGQTSKHAHIDAIKDYFLLFGPSITNTQLRDFLKIKSPDTASRLLTVLNLKSSGTTRNRIYFPPDDFFSR